MRSRLALEVTALLAATGALAGFATAQFLPRRYVARTTVAFAGSMASERFAYAADRTLSTAVLAPIVSQSAYYKSELDFTPVEEITQRIRDNASIRKVQVGGKDCFQVEFTDPDRYAALDVTHILADEMGRGAGMATQTIAPIRASQTGPGAGLCVLMGLGGGLALGLAISAVVPANLL